MLHPRANIDCSSTRRTTFGHIGVVWIYKGRYHRARVRSPAGRQAPAADAAMATVAPAAVDASHNQETPLSRQMRLRLEAAAPTT